MLQFDEATHSYTYSGAPVPGVTSILKPLTNFEAVPARVLEAASKFGSAVHLATELDDKGELDEQALDPALVPYLQAWRAFSRDYEVDWELIEAPLFHQTHRYAGTLDRAGRVRGMRAVLDIKTTANLYPTVGPQLAAYQQAWEPTALRYGVRLKSDGTYECKQYQDYTDWPVFVGLLTTRNFCMRHHINHLF